MGIRITNWRFNETQHHFSIFNSGDNYLDRPFLRRKINPRW